MSSETQAPLEVTSAAAWPTKDKADATMLVTLPSGGVAKLRRPPLQYYIASGQIPPKLEKLMSGADAEKILNDPLNLMTKEDRKVFIDWMIACAFVEPVVAMARKPGAVYIGDLDESDKEDVVGRLGLSVKG